MANLGICRKCSSCARFSPAYVDEDGNKTKLSYVECGMAHGFVGWDSEVPDGCPYVLEHRLTAESLADLEDDEDDA